MGECNCGCGGTTSGTDFMQGHDENVRSAVMYLLGGSTMGLCRIFGFGPDGRNAQKMAEDARAAKRRG
jgi:hypothetical protein